MAINETSLNKIFKKIFKGTFMSLPTGVKLSSFLKTIKDELQPSLPSSVSINIVQDMELQIHYNYAKSFSKFYHSKSYHDFSIKLNANKEVVFSQSYRSTCYPYSSTSEILELVNTLQEIYEGRKKDQLKKDKVISLKRQSIESRVKVLSEELNFEYTISTHFLNKVKVHIKLDRNLILEVDIPHSKFQEILGQLKEMILSARGILEKGASFKLRRTKR